MILREPAKILLGLVAPRACDAQPRGDLAEGQPLHHQRWPQLSWKRHRPRLNFGLGTRREGARRRRQFAQLRLGEIRIAIRRQFAQQLLHAFKQGTIQRHGDVCSQSYVLRAAQGSLTRAKHGPENLWKTRTKYAMHKDRELPYLAFRLVFRAGAAIRNVARSVQATSAESELQ